MLKVALNGELLPADSKVTVKRSINHGGAGWVNGRRLSPGETISMNGVVVFMEPQPDFRDVTLREDGQERMSPTFLASEKE